MKRFILISYYFPPGGGSGVLRWTKFTKYLREFGWIPHVITVEPEYYDVVDNSLMYDIGHVDIFRTELCRLPGINDIGVRWIPKALQLLCNLIRNFRPEAIVITAPPYMQMVLGYVAYCRYRIPYLLDYRDPWTVITPELHWASLPSTFKGKLLWRLALHLEPFIIRYASAVVTVSDPIKEAYLEKFPKEIEGKIKVIPHGFDPDDFGKGRKSTLVKDMTDSCKIKIMHVGSIINLRKAEPLLRGVKRLFRECYDLENKLHLVFVGRFENQSDLQLIKELDLTENVSIIKHQNHTDSVDLMCQADILWLDTGISWKSTISLKVFEYIAAQRPIVALCHPSGAAAELLKNTGVGILCGSDSDIDIANALRKAIAFVEGNVHLRTDKDIVMKCSWRTRAESLSNVLNQISACDK